MDNMVTITYGWNRVAYNILRSLAQKNIAVHVGDMSKLAMSFRSKYPAGTFLYPSFYRFPQKFIHTLQNHFETQKTAVYLPVHEETFVVAKYISELSATGVKIPISSFDTLVKLHLKDRAQKLAADLGIPTPRTISPSNFDEVQTFAKDIGFPVVLKLLNTNSGKGVFYAHDMEKLRAFYDKLHNENQQLILQEYVKGDGYGVSLLLNRGQVRASFTHKRLREKTSTGGTSTKRISTRNEELEEYAARILASVDFHGVAMVEFKYDETAARGWFIEINPRFWGSLALPIAAGVDFPFLLYEMALHGDVEPVTRYKEGITVRWLLGDALAMLSTIASQGKIVGPIKNLLTFNEDGFDDFFRDDIRVFFGEVSYYLGKFLQTRSINPTEDALLDVSKL